MKKSIIYLPLLVFSLFSCSDNNPITEEIPDEITNIVSEIQFASISELKTITFTTNKNWEASVNSLLEENWCKILPNIGGPGKAEITISVSENSSYDDRKAILTIKTGNIIKNVNVFQKRKSAILISTNKFEMSDEEGTFEVNVNTNIELIVSIPILI